MAPSTPEEEFLADKPISELRNYSKYDWQFAVFQLYIEACFWPSAHPTKCIDSKGRKDFITTEQKLGFPQNKDDFAPFRFWNRLAGLQTTDSVGSTRVDKATLIALENWGEFTRFISAALEGIWLGKTYHRKPLAAEIWINRCTAEIDRGIHSNSKKTLRTFLTIPDKQWLYEHCQPYSGAAFTLDCYYYASLFATWLQHEPAFFSQLAIHGHLDVNKPTRTAEMDATLKSLTPLIQWEHTLDVQQAFLELWWRDEPEHQKQLFRAVETIDEQSKQFFTAINSIHEQIHRAEDRGLSSEQAAQFHDAVEHVKFQIEHYHQSDSLRLDLNMDKRTNPDLKGIIPMLRLERTVLEKVIAFFLTKDFFYYDFYSIPNKSFAKARQEKVARIKQKEREQNESCSNALILAKMPFHQLKVRPQTDWLFAALEMFTVYYPWPESDDLEEHAQCPFLGLSQTERLSLIQREKDQGIHLKRMRSWNLYPGDDDNSYGPAIQAWVNEKIDRIGKAIASNSQSDEITFQNICIPDATHQWVIYGNPPRWWLYAALFNRLLADPPQWLNELPMKEINATIEASGNQPLKYASRPYQELLNGGYYKVMTGFYDATHDDLPHLKEGQEEAFIKRQAVLVERPALTPAAEQWVKDKRNALENAYRHQSMETLEQIIQPESAPEKALNGLWYSLACTNLELSFLCRILPAVSFLTLADQLLFKLAELAEDETHQAFYELAHNRVLECKDADERQRLFQVDRDEVTLGKGWVKFDEEAAIELRQWVQEILTEINQAAENKSLLTLREILFSKMPLPTRPRLCLKALWFSILFKGDQMTLSRLQLSQDTPNHEQTVQNHVAINAQPLQQAANSSQSLNPDSQLQTPQPAPQVVEPIVEKTEKRLQIKLNLTPLNLEVLIFMMDSPRLYLTIKAFNDKFWQSASEDETENVRQAINKIKNALAAIGFKREIIDTQKGRQNKALGYGLFLTDEELTLLKEAVKSCEILSNSSY